MPASSDTSQSPWGQGPHLAESLICPQQAHHPARRRHLTNSCQIDTWRMVGVSTILSIWRWNSNMCIRNCEVSLQILPLNTAFLTQLGLKSVRFPRVPATIFDLFYFCFFKTFMSNLKKKILSSGRMHIYQTGINRCLSLVQGSFNLSHDFNFIFPFMFINRSYGIKTSDK